MSVDNKILLLVDNDTLSIRELSKQIPDVNRSTITVHIKKLRKWGDIVPIRCSEKRRGAKGFIYTSRTNTTRRLLG